jgi:hypothetical protein
MHILDLIYQLEVLFWVQLKGKNLKKKKKRKKKKKKKKKKIKKIKKK